MSISSLGSANSLLSVAAIKQRLNPLATTASFTIQPTNPAQKKPADLADLLYHGDLSNMSWYDQTSLGQAVGFQLNLNGGNTSVSDAQKYQSDLDSDKNGTVDQSELSSGMSRLNASLQSGDSAAELNFAGNLQSNYAGVSGLDGKAGISQLDIIKLAGNTGQITGNSFLRASNLEAYNAQAANVSSVISMLASKYGYTFV